MPNPSLFTLVDNDQALTSYGPEFIDLSHLPDDLNARIADIQNYLRKIKVIEKDFPADLDLDTPGHKLANSVIQKYNEWLCKNSCIKLKTEFQTTNEDFFTKSATPGNTTYRKAYIQYLNDHFEDLINSSEVDVDIDLEAFFEKIKTKVNVNGILLSGLQLYQKAIEEEMNSTPFRRAVFYESLQIFKTNKDISKKPVFCLLGPSGSGKSFSRDAFFNQEFPKGDDKELMVFSADNGIPRSQSKMLTLTKQVLERSGYRVKDLDKDAKDYYKKFKVHLRQLGIDIQSTNANKQFGLFIPETFAKGILPKKSTMLNKNAKQYLNDLSIQQEALDNIDFYAGQITHENNEIFPHIVKIMAERRAFPELKSIQVAKTQREPFSFYPENLKEYKKYSASQFLYKYFGVNSSFVSGMKMANKVIGRWQEEKMPMKWVTVTNDLILVHYQGNRWRPCSKEQIEWFAKKHAREPDESYQVVSQALFKRWQKEAPQSDLMQFMKSNAKTIQPKIEVEDENILTMDLNKPKRYVPEPINQACIDGISAKGMLELALMCAINPEFQHKFPKLFNEVKSDIHIIHQMLRQIDPNHAFLAPPIQSKPKQMHMFFEQTVNKDRNLERVLEHAKLGL